MSSNCFMVVWLQLLVRDWLSLFIGYMQSLFGVYSLRIENVGVRRPPSDDVKIEGVANPNAFRKVSFFQRHIQNLKPFLVEISHGSTLPHQELLFAMLPFFSGSYDSSIKHEK